MSNDPTWQTIMATWGDTPLGVAKLDLHGNIVDCNTAFAELVGRDRVAAIGLNIVSDLTTRSDRPDTERRFQDLASDLSAVVSTEKELLRPFGGTSLLHVIAKPIADNGGEKPEYILDVLYSIGNSHSDTKVLEELEKLQESFTQLREIQSSKGGVTVNTGNHAGRDVIGGNAAGRDYVGGSVGGPKFLIIPLMLLIVAAAWFFYYAAKTSGGSGGTVEPPDIDVPSLVDSPSGRTEKN